MRVREQQEGNVQKQTQETSFREHFVIKDQAKPTHLRDVTHRFLSLPPDSRLFTVTLCNLNLQSVLSIVSHEYPFPIILRLGISDLMFGVRLSCGCQTCGKWRISCQIGSCSASWPATVLLLCGKALV